MPSLSLIPLDDRPCCLDFVERLAGLAGVKVKTPPRPLLGSFTRPGQPEALLDWLEGQTDRRVLASLDMVCWGGLVASRQPDHALATALARLERFHAITAGRHVYAFNAILRTAPTQTTPEEVTEAEKLVDLSELAARLHKGDDSVRSEFERIQAAIRPKRLAAYHRTRQRNHQLNARAIELSADWKALLIGVDDSRTEGWNLLELDQLKAGADGRPVWFAPGTDEMAHLLLVRALGVSLSLQPVWSHPGLAERVTRYEDRPLGALLEAQAAAAGLKLGPSLRKLFVFGPTGHQREAATQSHGSGARAERFAREIGLAIEEGALVAVADVSYANGADRGLVRCLRTHGLLSRLAGFAAWNTAGNTVGTALASLALFDVRRRDQARRFVLERLGDDFLYQSVVRNRLKARLGPGLKLEPAVLSQAQQLLDQEMSEPFARLTRDVGLDDTRARFELPWGRLFEVRVTT
ncbi:MAG: DUF4127 family protein [Candidatus Eremiobacteraeota bacterium]|nr:DUF4127 family protein [Candidatus Eremiobacteraeota bacterium]